MINITQNDKGTQKEQTVLIRTTIPISVKRTLKAYSGMKGISYTQVLNDALCYYAKKVKKDMIAML